jgi:hypothetical protein
MKFISIINVLDCWVKYQIKKKTKSIYRPWITAKREYSTWIFSLTQYREKKNNPIYSYTDIILHSYILVYCSTYIILYYILIRHISKPVYFWHYTTSKCVVSSTKKNHDIFCKIYIFYLLTIFFFIWNITIRYFIVIYVYF